MLRHVVRTSTASLPRLGAVVRIERAFARRSPRRIVAAGLPPVLTVGLSSAVIAVASLATASPAAAAQANCTPDAGYTNCAVYTYSGADQSFAVPTGLNSVLVKSWGAGGGGVDSSYYANNAGGGAGGFSSGTLAVTGGSNLSVVVGQGGRVNSSAGGSLTSTYGGGGAGGAQGPSTSAAQGGSSGGGLSGVFTGTPSRATAQIVAGGGGGASPGSDTNAPVAGGGGGTSGGQDTQPQYSGRGGTQTAGGAGATATDGCLAQAASGSVLAGGAGSSATGSQSAGSSSGEGGGGGGGGWYGGGGGKCQTQPGTANGDGGGGSGYVGASGVTGGTTVAGGNSSYGTPGSGGAAPSTVDAQYQSGVGVGGGVSTTSSNLGGNGLVVIEWKIGYTIAKSASPANPSPGGTETYTLTITNTGGSAYSAGSPASFVDNLSGVLDDASYNNDASSSVAGWTFARSGTNLTGSGPLAVGQTATITYSVAISSNPAGNAVLSNTITPGANGSCGSNCSTTTPIVAQSSSCPQASALQNGSFENPVVPAGASAGNDISDAHFVQNGTPGLIWRTTAPNGANEFWRNGGTATASNGGQAITAQDGQQWVELNATTVGSEYQDLTTVPGQVLRYSLWHRARYTGSNTAQDVMQVQVGAPGGTLVAQVPNGQTSANISDGPLAWVNHQGFYTVPAGQTTTRFQFQAVSSSTGDNSFGNFLDNISFGSTPCISNVKSVTDVTSGAGSIVRPGDTLQYTMVVKNNGGDASANTVLTDAIPTGTTYVPGSITIDGTGKSDATGDDTASFSNGTITANLGTGASATSGGAIALNGSTTVTFQVKVNASVTAGTAINNRAQTNYLWPPSSTPLSTTSNAAVVTVDTPAISETTSVAGTTDANGNGRVDIGDSINYNFVVTNTGSTPLNNVTVTAANATNISCPSTTLAPGATETCTGTHVVSFGDGAAGQVVTSATATGTPPGSSNSVTSNPPSSVTTPIDASSLSVTKTNSPTSITTIGQIVTSTIKIANTGATTLTVVTPTDVITSPPNETATATGCTPTLPGPLTAGSTAICTYTHAVTQADLSAGGVGDSGTVTATTPTGSKISTSTAPVTSTTSVTGGLAITKSATPSSITSAGQTISYQIVVSNNSNVPVSGVSVQDTLVAPAAPSPKPVCPSTTIQPGAQLVCTASYQVTQTDIDNGSVSNTATVSGQTPGGSTLTATTPSTATIPVTANPALSVTTTNSPSTYSSVGQSVTSTTTVTNSGQKTLTNVTVADVFGANTPPASFSCTPTVPATLAPGDTITCTATHTVTQADLDNGSIVSTASASGTAPDKTTVSGTGVGKSTASQNPSFTLVKSASPSTVTTANTVVTYSFKVTNTGNVTLSGLKVTDAQAQPAQPANPTVTCPTGSIAPGASATCTATYTVSQTDLDAGAVTDSATASANGPNGTTAPAQTSGAAVAVTQGPALTISGVSAPTAVTAAGQQITYTYTVRNTGNVTAPTVAVASTTGATGTKAVPACQATTLAPGASTTCTATYTVTQADMDSVSKVIPDSATATGNTAGNATITSNTVSVPVTVTSSPSFTLTKSANPASTSAAGQTIVYTIVAKNTGNVTLSLLKVIDTMTAPSVSPTVTCPQTTIAPNTTVSCTASYLTTQADIDNGSLSNAVTGSAQAPDGTTTNGSGSGATVPVSGATPSLSVTTTNSPTSYSSVGQTITSTIVATNNGQQTLKNVTVTDLFGTTPADTITCTPTTPVATLAPGQSITCTATHKVTQPDIDAGSVKSTATATGTTPGNTTLTGSGSGTSTATQTVALSLVKTASPTTISTVGQKVTYNFAATNNGNVTLTGLVVTDTQTAPAGSVAPTVTCPTTTVAPGATVNCQGVYIVTQADLDSGSISDTGSATAQSPSGTTTTAPASAVTVSATQGPALSLSTVASPTSVSAAGVTVTYTYTVTNTGNVNASTVAVTNTIGASAATPVVTCNATTLAPGAATTCTSTYRVTQADIDAGALPSTAQASANTPGGTPFRSTVVSTPVAVNSNPGISVTKTASPAAVSAVNQAVNYQITVANTGNTTISGIQVADKLVAPAGPSPTPDCQGITSLAPSKTLTCTASYVTTQADIDNGSLSNNATATGKLPNGTSLSATSSTATVPVSGPASGLTVTANNSPATYNAVGQVVTTTIQVTNSGQRTLTNVDGTDLFGAGTAPDSYSCTPPVPVANSAPGATINCTASHAVTQADLDSGSVVSNVTASGKDPSGSSVNGVASATSKAVQTPAFTLVKSATPTTVSRVGQPIALSFVVSNTGNVTLSNVAVVDVQGNGGQSPAVTCPTTSVSPGNSITCTATYVVTQTDVDAGAVSDSATATASGPSGTTVSGQSSTVSVAVNQTASLALTGVVAPASVTAADTPLTYSYTVTNTGTVNLTGLGVSETAGTLTATPTVKCNATSLAPGANTTCTSTYNVTQTDMDSPSGTVPASATATAKTPGGTTVTSGPASTPAKVSANPSLTVTKTANPTSVSKAGTVVNYQIAVQNTGNVTLSVINATDNLIGASGTSPTPTCASTTAAPGVTVVCTAQYTVLQGDIDNGSLSNSAKATAKAPDGSSISASTSVATVAVGNVNSSLSVTETADQPSFNAPGQPIIFTATVKNTGDRTINNVSITDASATAGSEPLFTCIPTSLAPGASAKCTATYTTTQGDVDAGQVTDTVAATGLDSAGATVTSTTASANVPAVQVNAVSVTSTATPNTPNQTSVSAVGDKINYSSTVTNKGNTTLTNVGVGESQTAPAGNAVPMTCLATTLAPGASTQCTGTYTVTQDDLDNGSVNGTAIAVGSTPAKTSVSSPAATTSVPVTSTGGLSLVKTADMSRVATVGQSVTYSFTLTNTGALTLNSPVVTDTFTAPAVSPGAVTCPTDPIAPNATVVCKLTYTVTQADLNNGSISNTASATAKTNGGKTIQSGLSSTVVTASQLGRLTVTKSVSPTTVSKVGDQLTYSFLVSNTGNIDVSSIGVQDSFNAPAGPNLKVTCPTTVLVPGASTTCTAPAYAVSQADLDAGSVTNSASVSGVGKNGNPVQSTTPSAATVSVTTSSGLSVTGSANPTTVSKAGDLVSVEYDVTNNGNQTVSGVGVAVTGPNGASITVTCVPATLAPGATAKCTVNYTATQSDIDAGSISISGKPSATTPGGVALTADPKTVTVGVAPNTGGLTVTPAANPTPVSAAGQTVTLTDTVTNTGSQTATGVTVSGTDPNGNSITYTCTASSLAPNASTTCTATYVTTQADVDSGSLKFPSSAAGTIGGKPTTVPTSVTVPVKAAPALSNLGAATPSIVTKAGDPVTVTYTVSNTGNQTVANLIETAQTASGTALTFTCTPTSIAPGANSSCVAAYTATQGDIDAGSIIINGIASGAANGAPVSSGRSTVTVGVAPNSGGLAVTLSSNPTSVSQAGVPVTVTVTVTNNGTQTASGVTAQGTGPDGKALTFSCGASSLAPGASTTCTATYTPTQGDVDNGTLPFATTVTGTIGGKPTSVPGTLNVPVTATTGLTVTGSATPGTVSKAGDVVSVEYDVTNNGNQTVTGVTTSVTGPNNATITVRCTPTTLAPGTTSKCTGTYTATQGDIDAGSISISGTPKATAPGGVAVTGPPKTVAVGVTPSTGGLGITTSATPASITAPGGQITVTDVVTNNGTQTASGLTVSGTDPNGKPLTYVCDVTSLAPKASTNCKATYTPTQGDVDTGALVFPSSAAATVSGNPTSTGQVKATVPVTVTSGLTATGSVAPTTVSMAGQPVKVTYSVQNTGNQTVSGAGVSVTTPDGRTLPLTCIPATVAPGQTTSCTAQYVTTQDDIDRGSVTFTGTASATSPTGTIITSQPSVATLGVLAASSLTLTKGAQPGTVSSAGQTVVYSFTVTNTGGTTVKNVAVTDPRLPSTGRPICPATTLAPGASTICSGSYIVTQSDVDNGSIMNMASAAGVAQGGVLVMSNSSSAVVAVLSKPGLTVSQTPSPTSISVIGQKVTFTVSVTNSGNVSLSGITAAEVLDGPATLSGTPVCAKSALAPGETTLCTITYTSTAADFDKGQIRGVASATGTTTAGGTQVAGGPVDVSVVTVQQSQLAMTKIAVPHDLNSNGIIDRGDTISYSFKVTNNGTVTLVRLAITDPLTGNVTCPTTTLAAGATITCTADAEYAVSQADVDAGTVKNTATATASPGPGGPTVSVQASVSTPTGARAGLGLVKQGQLVDTNNNGRVDAGDLVNWTFTLTNTGGTTLTGLAVQDPAGGAVTCPATSLAPGATAQCKSQTPTAVSQKDIDAGTISNTATATANDPSNNVIKSDPSTATVPLPSSPSLALTKSGRVVDTNRDGRTDVGDTVIWSFLITNTGNVTEQGIKVNDNQVGVVTCPTSTLTPGQSVTCVASAVDITAANVAAGKLTNTATATGIGLGTAGVTVTSAPSTATVDTAGQTVSNPPSNPGTSPVAYTGAKDLPYLVGLSVLLLLLGLLFTLAGATRRRREDPGQQ